MDIAFYNKAGDTNYHTVSVSVSDNLYEHFSKTAYSKIGTIRNYTININNEELELDLVEITDEIRSRLIDYLLVELIEKIRPILSEDSSQSESDEHMPDARTLLELLDMAKNPALIYFDKIGS